MSSAGSLSLVGGVLALDFANTASGQDTATPSENLHSPSDLVDWARHAGSIDDATAARCARAFATSHEEATRVFRDALALRSAIYRVGADIAHHHAPDETALHAIRDAARDAMASAELRPSAAGGYRFDFGSASPEAAIVGPLALSAIDFLATADFSRVKQCPGHGPGHECQWLFLDLSKNNSRRWCDMSTCGNRSKAKRHRSRRAGE